MGGEFLGLLLRANLAASAAILLILAIRTPVAQRFGARAAYGLWWTAPLAAAASLLPARTVTVEAPAAGLPAIVTSGAQPLAEAAVGQAVSGLLFDPALALFPAWLFGAAAFLALLMWRQLGFSRQLGRLTPEAGVYRSEAPGVGPAVIGALRPRIVLPADFEARFSPEERAVVLEHERAHLRNGDHWINGLTALAQCLSWFNPLVHLAAFHLRLDQELACDAVVLTRHPQARRSYAEALLKTQISAAALPLGCAWPARAPHPLKLRIAMLKDAPSGPRRVAGLAFAAAVSVAAGAAAWAAQPPKSQVKVVAEETGVAATAVADKASLDKIARVREAARRDAEARRPATRERPPVNGDVDRYMPGDGTPLIIAARWSDVVTARDLLARGADPNRAAPGDGNPLIVASAAGHVAIAQMLLDHGADVNGFVLGDETPLIKAARSQNLHMVRFLVEHGADVNLRVPSGNLPGEMRSPLSVTRDPIIADYLRAQGARS
jgi:beta-lactamase regulating signal transducer with metallopeptidase domain